MRSLLCSVGVNPRLMNILRAVLCNGLRLSIVIWYDVASGVCLSMVCMRAVAVRRGDVVSSVR